MEAFRSKLIFSLLVFCLSSLSSASAFPKQTPQAEDGFAVDGWSPKPTSPPLPGLLNKRQATPDLTGRGSNTCGYISADQNKPIVCGDGYTCTTDTSRKRIGCCAMTGPSSDCVLGNACYDFDGAASCKDNNNCSPAMLCTETATPYCNTYSFEDNSFTDFFCHTAALGVQKGRTNFITPSGLSKDQKIAVGVGVGVGAPTLSFFIALIFFPRFRKRTKQVFTGDFSFQVIWGGDVVHGDKFTGNKQMGDLVVGDKRVAGSGEASGSKPAETPSPSVQVLTQSVPQEGTTNKIPRGLGWLEGLGKGKNTKGAAG